MNEVSEKKQCREHAAAQVSQLIPKRSKVMSSRLDCSSLFVAATKGLSEFFACKAHLKAKTGQDTEGTFCHFPRTYAAMHPQDKPWMLLMLGGAGAGKGTFLRAAVLVVILSPCSSQFLHAVSVNLARIKFVPRS